MPEIPHEGIKDAPERIEKPEEKIPTLSELEEFLKARGERLPTAEEYLAMIRPIEAWPKTNEGDALGARPIVRVKVDENKEPSKK